MPTVAWVVTRDIYHQPNPNLGTCQSDCVTIKFLSEAKFHFRLHKTIDKTPEICYDASTQTKQGALSWHIVMVVDTRWNFFLKPSKEYVSPDDPVRVYDAFVETINCSELGLVLDAHKVGCPEYNPKVMLKLLLYGYSYGFRSSRKLERALYHNVSFIWLMGGLKPDHKTIAEFRRKNKAVLKDVLKTCARLCIKLGLIAGNTLFVDSTRVRANASIKNAWGKEKCKRALEKIKARIEAILSECDAVDEEEENQDSLIKVKKELKDKRLLKAKVKNILKELNQTKKKSINTTNRECTRISGIQGSHAGYSLHGTVDEKNGLLVNSDVRGEANDLNQFAQQVNQANEVLEKKCDVACADSGYAYTRELEKIDEQEIKVIVPSQKQASGKKSKAFDKVNF